MRRADLARVSELSVQLGYPASPESLHSRFATIAADGAQGLFVAELDGRVIGWIHVHPRVLLESEPYAEIGGLVVDTGARRSGAGRALVREAERFARSAGFATMRVRSNVVRVEAHAFYPALGYAQLKTQHSYTKVLQASASTSPP